MASKEEYNWSLGEEVTLPRTERLLKKSGSRIYHRYINSRYICIREASDDQPGILLKVLGKAMSDDVFMVSSQPFSKDHVDDLFEGRLYIQTGKVKAVSKQLQANPKAEICAFKDGKWLRVAVELINDDDRAVKVAMLEKMPSLKAMYDPDDGNTQVLYFKNATATFSSFTEAPETVTF